MATFTVTTLDDEAAGTTDLATEMADGDGLSLREAIAIANADTAADTIDFAAALTGGTLTLTMGELALTTAISIDGDTNGDDAADITISGNNASRIFNISGPGTDAQLFSLTLTGGNAGMDNGGAIYAHDQSTLTVSDSTISGSTANDGGGIFSEVNLDLSNALITGNTATNNGGGLFEFIATADLNNTTIYGNTADEIGGGIAAVNANLNLNNSTVTGNQADADGTLTFQGGGIAESNTTETFNNSVIAGNTSGSGAYEAANDTRGFFGTANNSFFGTTATLDTNNNSTNGGGDPLLGVLQDNGGTTNTQNAQLGSPLIDAGDSALIPTGVTEDANGNPRALGQNVDIGATESLFSLSVTTLDDEAAGTTDFATELADGNGLSLREAIAVIGAGGSISFDSSLAGGTATLTMGELALTSDVTIDGDTNGDEAADITISGNNASRIFNISGGGTDVDLLSLTLTGGNAGAGDGGAILADGATLDIVDTTISNSVGVDGGGIYSEGSLTLTNSLITGNFAAGGVTGAGQGGGINQFTGMADLTNTTIYGNVANQGGGGLYTNSSLRLYNSTVTGNQADADGNSNFGGGIDNYNGTVILANTVVAGNTSGMSATADDVFSVISSATNSFIGTNEIIINDNGGNTNGGGDPGLGALANNGGTIQTQNPVADSPLINAGDNTYVPAGITTDANGADRFLLGTTDIGATEFALVVTTLDDVVADDGLLSLREAVTLANADAGADTITFSSAITGGTTAGVDDGSITLTMGQLALTQDVTIDGDTNGDDRADITISGNNASRIFSITTGDVALSSLDLTAGSASEGGALRASGGTLTLTDSTVRDSYASYAGGGIYLQGSAQLYVLNSTLSGNTAGIYGGGLSAADGATAASLTNATISGNDAFFYGGGAFLGDSTLTLTNSTVSGNSAIVYGGGVYSRFGSVTANNTVIAQNTANIGGDDIYAAGGTLTAQNSFFGTNVGIDTDNGGNQNNAGDPMLGELLDNGGTVLTQSPLNTLLGGPSPLIGTGSNAVLPMDTFDIDDDGDTTETLPLDGRGGLRIVGGTVDIGAVEQFDDETIRGTPADNTIIGGLGTDVLEGLGGNDTLDGGDGADMMSGGTGNDRYFVDNAGDTVTEAFAGSGFDVVLSTVTVNLTSSNFTGVINAVTLQGTGDINAIGDIFANILTGNSGNNVLNGLGGADNLRGIGGNDTYVIDNVGDIVDESLAGSSGSDRVLSTIDVDLTDAARFLGDIERVELQGSANLNATGSAIANGLFGNDGDNVLDGGLGNDLLTGGLGADSFRFSTAPGMGNVDTIADFDTAIDSFLLDSSVFAALGPTVDASEFRVFGTGPQDADDFLLYNAANGALFYDADAAGGANPLIFAVLTGAPNIDETNFLVV